MMKVPKISIKDYTYDLPSERIASYPLEVRDSSKLLIYNKGIIDETSFYALPELISHNSIMVFNITKVVPARLLFRKDSGAFIEVFCLEPHLPSDYNISFSQTSFCVWKAIVGNAKRWKGGSIGIYVPKNEESILKNINLKASVVSQEEGCYYVEFKWDGGYPFSQVLDVCGKIPIPPYLNRETESIDNERYQTLYAKYRGSVAAPTAGLHFTERVLNNLKNNRIDCQEVCLHVGAGTFLPVKSEYICDHIMHSEPFSVSKSFLERLYSKSDSQKVVSVGTTSTRTLESLYYLGAQCIKATPEKWIPDGVTQWEPYNSEYDYTLKETIKSLINYLEINNLTYLNVRTQIIILPTYKFRVVDILITNFHQPQSTLLLLIAAFIGEDWKKVYKYALEHNFRFLSYGDSSILFRGNNY